MATIRKHGNKWQARIQRRNQPLVAKSFDNKADAEKWIRALEREMDLGVYVCRTPLETTTLGDLFKRYRAEVSPLKKAGQQEQRRIDHLCKDPIAKLAMASLSSRALATFRDKRLNTERVINGKGTGACGATTSYPVTDCHHCV